MPPSRRSSCTRHSTWGSPSSIPPSRMGRARGIWGRGWGRGGGRANIMRAVEDSLRALKTDYIDLYQQHRPDPNVPVSETLEALETLKKQGKVREAGCSNFTKEMLEEAAQRQSGTGRAKFVSVQNE